MTKERLKEEILKLCNSKGISFDKNDIGNIIEIIKSDNKYNINDEYIRKAR